MKAYGFDIRNCSITRVTPPTQICIDHLFVDRDIESETLETLFTDHLTIVAKIPRKPVTYNN